MRDNDLMLTSGQYDLLTIDKPEKQRVFRPESKIVEALRPIFIADSDRYLYMAARKLYNNLGVEAALHGLDALCLIPGWYNFVKQKGVKVISMTTRIEQAAASSDKLHRENAVIFLELGRRKALLNGTEQVLTEFMQDVHTASPLIRRQIKDACELVVRGAFQLNVEHGLELVARAVEIARKDEKKIKYIRDNYRVPKETAQWLLQILARLT